VSAIGEFKDGEGYKRARRKGVIKRGGEEKKQLEVEA
jgi:hypothetical protein